jgi:hypothetical protein
MKNLKCLEMFEETVARKYDIEMKKNAMNRTIVCTTFTRGSITNGPSYSNGA